MFILFYFILFYFFLSFGWISHGQLCHCSLTMLENFNCEVIGLYNMHMTLIECSIELAKRNISIIPFWA